MRSTAARLCTLLGAVNDATREILALQLRSAEDLHGYVRDVFTAHGLPLTAYADRPSVQVRNSHWSLDEQLAGRQLPELAREGHFRAHLFDMDRAAPQPLGKGSCGHQLPD